ncbi:BID domain-containing T4SS effector [Bartonella pachyuromydis]|uniref:BepD protein n=1 Tax=Bartonella pachyuromydis TaxID=931097 RepID=A0ABP8VIH2_9HYPH
MKKNHPSPSNTVDELRRRFERQNLQEQGATGGEPLYAKVNKPPKHQHPQKPEESGYASLRAQETTPPYPQETIYAPQKPMGNPYDRPPTRPSNGQQATKLVEPYDVIDLSKLGKEPISERLKNPLYESVGGRNPQSPETPYAEISFGSHEGRPTQKDLESVYATINTGAAGGPSPQQRENPFYEGADAGRTTPSPRTPEDEIRAKMMQNPHFQYGLMEVQERCQIVYGNRNALNTQLANILSNPQGGEKFLWDLAADPESAGKLAGQKVLGVKSSARREAEEEFGALCSSLEKHIILAQKLHKSLTREQERGRGHERGEHQEGHEHDHHRHHHHRSHSHERGQHSPEQTRGRQSPEHSKVGMAFAM